MLCLRSVPSSVPQIIFASALAGVVATQLDQQQIQPGSPGPGVGLLNSKGYVCTFTYITAGEIIIISFLLLLPLAYFNRKGEPLYAVYLSLALFSLFWQLVMAITIQIRGDQANSSGYPQQSARQAAWAFSWLGVAFSSFQAIIVALDLFREWRQEKKAAKKLDFQKSLRVDSISITHGGVGIGY